MLFVDTSWKEMKILLIYKEINMFSSFETFNTTDNIKVRINRKYVSSIEDMGDTVVIYMLNGHSYRFSLTFDSFIRSF